MTVLFRLRHADGYAKQLRRSASTHSVTSRFQPGEHPPTLQLIFEQSPNSLSHFARKLVLPYGAERLLYGVLNVGGKIMAKLKRWIESITTLGVKLKIAG